MTEETTKYIKMVHALGFNISMLFNLFRKRSKLREPLPEEVIQRVCKQYLLMNDKIDKSFPYFLRVLKSESEKYFARRNEAEGQRLKTEPWKIKITIG